MEQLEELVRKKIDPAFADHIDMEDQRDAFYTVGSVVFRHVMNVANASTVLCELTWIGAYVRLYFILEYSITR